MKASPPNSPETTPTHHKCAEAESTWVAMRRRRRRETGADGGAADECADAVTRKEERGAAGAANDDGTARRTATLGETVFVDMSRALKLDEEALLATLRRECGPQSGSHPSPLGFVLLLPMKKSARKLAKKLTSLLYRDLGHEVDESDLGGCTEHGRLAQVVRQNLCGGMSSAESQDVAWLQCMGGTLSAPRRGPNNARQLLVLGTAKGLQSVIAPSVVNVRTALSSMLLMLQPAPNAIHGRLAAQAISPIAVVTPRELAAERENRDPNDPVLQASTCFPKCSDSFLLGEDTFLAFLPIVELDRMRLVSRRMRRICEHDRFWRDVWAMLPARIRGDEDSCTSTTVTDQDQDPARLQETEHSIIGCAPAASTSGEGQVAQPHQAQWSAKPSEGIRAKYVSAVMRYKRARHQRVITGLRKHERKRGGSVLHERLLWKWGELGVTVRCGNVNIPVTETVGEREPAWGNPLGHAPPSRAGGVRHFLSSASFKLAVDQCDVRALVAQEGESRGGNHASTSKASRPASSGTENTRGPETLPCTFANLFSSQAHDLHVVVQAAALGESRRVQLSPSQEDIEWVSSNEAGTLHLVTISGRLESTDGAGAEAGAGAQETGAARTTAPRKPSAKRGRGSAAAAATASRPMRACSAGQQLQLALGVYSETPVHRAQENATCKAKLPPAIRRGEVAFAVVSMAHGLVRAMLLSRSPVLRLASSGEWTPPSMHLPRPPRRCLPAPTDGKLAIGLRTLGVTLWEHVIDVLDWRRGDACEDAGVGSRSPRGMVLPQLQSMSEAEEPLPPSDAEGGIAHDHSAAVGGGGHHNVWVLPPWCDSTDAWRARVLVGPLDIQVRSSAAGIRDRIPQSVVVDLSFQEDDGRQPQTRAGRSQQGTTAVPLHWSSTNVARVTSHSELGSPGNTAAQAFLQPVSFVLCSTPWGALRIILNPLTEVMGWSRDGYGSEELCALEEELGIARRSAAAAAILGDGNDGAEGEDSDTRTALEWAESLRDDEQPAGTEFGAAGRAPQGGRQPATTATKRQKKKKKRKPHTESTPRELLLVWAIELDPSSS